MNSIKSYRAIAIQPITINGETRTLSEWAKLHNLPYSTVAMRWVRGHRDPAALLYKRAPLQPITLTSPEPSQNEPPTT